MQWSQISVCGSVRHNSICAGQRRQRRAWAESVRFPAQRQKWLISWSQAKVQKKRRRITQIQSVRGKIILSGCVADGLPRVQYHACAAKDWKTFCCVL